MTWIPLEGFSGTGSQEAAVYDKQGEVASAPHLCRGHHTHACEALRESRTQHRARRLRQAGCGRWGRGRRVQQVRKTSRSYHSTADLAPDPQQPSAQLHTPASKIGVPGGLLSTLWLPKGPSGRSPQGQVPLLLKVWSWPYRQPQRQHTFLVCFPARKWKPAASPAHAAGSVLLPGAWASSQALQTPSMFSLHRNRHNTEPAGVDGRPCPAVQGSSELEADQGTRHH